MYTPKKVIGMLINANLLNVSNSWEFIDYIRGKKGIYSIPDFGDKFFNWANGKSEKAVLDKAALCHNLMKKNEPIEKILKAINKQPSIYDCSTPTEEQAKEIMLNDLNKNWIRKFIESSCNKQEVIQALFQASSLEITETGWHSKINNIDEVIACLVNDSNLYVLIEYKNANAAFENYLKKKYPNYSKYIEYMIAYMKDSNNFGIKGKNKVLELCNRPKLFLSPEFDTERLNKSIKGDIIVNGAGRIVKELADNLKCSKAEATKLVINGRTTWLRIVSSEFHGNYPIRERDWQIYRWWKNKKNSTEWNKIRTTYLPAGKVIHWRWIDRVDEIRVHHIHNENESPSIVMNRVFKEAEEKQFVKEELLKAMPSFPECLLKGNEEFKQVKTPLELYQVGKAFNNCAFTYKKALERGESFIFTSSDVCAEICQNNDGKWKIQQCLGHHNSLVTKKIYKRFKKWFEAAVKSASL